MLKPSHVTGLGGEGKQQEPSVPFPTRYRVRQAQVLAGTGITESQTFLKYSPGLGHC